MIASSRPLHELSAHLAPRRDAARLAAFTKYGERRLTSGFNLPLLRRNETAGRREAGRLPVRNDAIRVPCAARWRRRRWSMRAACRRSPRWGRATRSTRRRRSGRAPGAIGRELGRPGQAQFGHRGPDLDDGGRPPPAPPPGGSRRLPCTARTGACAVGRPRRLVVDQAGVRRRIEGRDGVDRRVHVDDVDDAQPVPSQAWKAIFVPSGERLAPSPSAGQDRPEAGAVGSRRRYRPFAVGWSSSHERELPVVRAGTTGTRCRPVVRCSMTTGALGAVDGEDLERRMHPRHPRTPPPSIRRATRRRCERVARCEAPVSGRMSLPSAFATMTIGS